MKYRPLGMNMWDAWMIHAENRYHMYHLQMLAKDSNLTQRDADFLGHAVSDDGIRFTECPRILAPGEGGNPRDVYQKWTGCTVEHNGLYYLFYTMRCNEGLHQSIGVATSTDLYNFTVYDQNPVIAPDPELFISYGNSEWNGTVDCRDMVVVKDPDSDGFYGFFAVTAKTGEGLPAGVIGAAYSEDLLHWRQTGVAYDHRRAGIVEVPDVFKLGDKWYMICLTACCYGNRGFFSDDHVIHGTIYAVSDTLQGPYHELDDNVFMGASTAAGNCCRTVESDGSLYVYDTEPNNGNNCLSLPKLVGLNRNGYLRPLYTELVHKARTDTLIAKGGELPAINDRFQTSFAWNLKGGEFCKSAAGYRAKTNRDGYQYALLPYKAKNFELHCTVRLDTCAAAGVVFASENEEGCQRYCVLLEKAKRQVVLSSIYGFETLSVRSYPFCEEGSVDVKMIVADNNCDVFLDEELVIQAPIYNRGANTPGFLVDRGETEFTHIELHALID